MMIPAPRQSSPRYVVSRDWQGCSTIDVVINGLPYEAFHSRNYTREEWTALVEEVTGSGADTATREALRRSPAEVRRQ